MRYRYHLPTKIVFGPGSLDALSSEPLPGKKALVVLTDGPAMRGDGYLEQVLSALNRQGVAHAVFDRVRPNPVKSHVMDGAVIARAERCDFVLGLGGGSSIDSAKAIAVMTTNPGDYWDYVHGGTGRGEALRQKPLPVVAVVTTAGTGTEVDPWAVITKEETNEKIGFGNAHTFPVLAIVDPVTTLTVPPELTAYQGFDALFHAVEGYLATSATPFSDLYALESIRLIARHLPECVHNGSNLEARTHMAQAATLAGMVESLSGPLSEHSLEHALSAYHPDLPHGAGLLMLSEAYFGHFAAAAPGRFADMARAMGVDVDDMPGAAVGDDRATAFLDALTALEEACGVRGLCMSDYGIRKSDIPVLVENARNNMGSLFALDPQTLSPEDARSILEKAYR